MVKGTRLMLSGEVGYYRGTMQLTHPGFLILNSPSGRLGGTKSLKTIAASAADQTGDFDM
jgi:ATP-dependent DNA helicase RecG